MSRPTSVAAFPTHRILRRCGDCTGWDGGSDEIGDCQFREREVGRKELACPDFFRMPSFAELRDLR